VNRIQRSLVVRRIQIADLFAHHQTQFHLIVQVGAARSENRTLAGDKDRGRGLQEEEGLLGLRVVQLCDVVAVGSALVAMPRRCEIERAGDLRVVSADANDLAAIGAD
jgi:hypothetical protein